MSVIDIYGKRVSTSRSRLGNEVFATEVAKVREVLDFTTITEIPRTPDFNERCNQPSRQRGAGG